MSTSLLSFARSYPKAYFAKSESLADGQKSDFSSRHSFRS